MYHYKSEATQFLDKLMADHPELEAQRPRKPPFYCRDRKPFNPAEQAEFEAAKVNKKPYTYYQD